MGQKIPTDFGDEGEVPSWVLTEQDDRREAELREFELRIRMFALDMAVQALPSLTSEIDPEATKLATLRRAESEFEKILRGEN